MGTWDYSLIEDDERRALLGAAPPFTQIAQAVAKRMDVCCTHSDPCDQADGYTRIVCCVRVEGDLFDLFFNSESGYRGRYFASPLEGLAANWEMLALVASPLANFRVHDKMSSEEAFVSLRAKSAKCWLAEVGKGFCKICAGEWTTPQDAVPEILNGRWERADDPKARYGRKAPRHTQLRMLGAFVNQVGQEYVVSEKRDREKQIHKFGWT